MNELSLSDTNYFIKSNTEGSEIIIESNNIIKAYDVIHADNDGYIIAIQNYYETSMYYVEYLFLSDSFELLQVLREDKGVNPGFILAPDNTVWVGMSSTCTEKTGEIFLPLRNRNRIIEPILKRDTGMDYFLFQNKSYGFIRDFFEEKKESKLAVFQYDKNCLFKNRKQIKLQNIYGGSPIVVDNRCYISDCVRSEDKFYSLIYEISGNGEEKLICTTDKTDIPQSFIIDVNENGFSVISKNGNKIEQLLFSEKGELVNKITVYEDDKETINYLNVSSLDNCVVINFVSDLVGVIMYREKKFYLHTEPLSTKIRGISRDYVLISGTQKDRKNIKICRIQ